MTLVLDAIRRMAQRRLAFYEENGFDDLAGYHRRLSAHGAALSNTFVGTFDTVASFHPFFAAREAVVGRTTSNSRVLGTGDRALAALVFIPITRGGRVVGYLDEAGNTLRALRFTADEVPSPSNFAPWFNDLRPGELAAYLQNPAAKKRIARGIRYPGGWHEWYAVSRVQKFKNWGLSIEDIWSFRTKTSNLKWVNPKTGLAGFHGGIDSPLFHKELFQLIDSSRNLSELNSGLINLANRWSIPNLPTIIRNK